MVDVVPIDLALQGGGAHGAFTWGVLDRLLDERGLPTSPSAVPAPAPSMPSCSLTGCSREVGPVHRRHFGPFGKPSAARHTAQPANNPFYAFFLTTGGQLPHWLTSGPWAASIEIWHKFADSLTRPFSPYQWNPFNINP